MEKTGLSLKTISDPIGHSKACVDGERLIGARNKKAWISHNFAWTCDKVHSFLRLGKRARRGQVFDLSSVSSYPFNVFQRDKVNYVQWCQSLDSYTSLSHNVVLSIYGLLYCVKSANHDLANHNYKNELRNPVNIQISKSLNASTNFSFKLSLISCMERFAH